MNPLKSIIEKKSEMTKLAKSLIAQIGTLASLLGLFFTIYNSSKSMTGFQWFLLFTALVLFLLSVYLEIKEHIDNKPKIFTEKNDIRDYMYRWIKNSGRTAIFTRDMSWVDDDEMRSLLKNKAEKDELIICMPRIIDKVKELQDKGAKVFEYKEISYIPLSRFTITNFGRDDAKVAVGRRLAEKQHLIEEFSAGQHPYFQIANDLIQILSNKQ